MAGELEGMMVAILATDGFEQVELEKPQQALQAAGAQTRIVSPTSARIQGMNHKEKGDKLEVIGAEAGMHLVALLPRGVNDVEVSKKADELGISAMPLSTCCLRPPARGGLILGYGGTDPQQIHDGVRKLRMCI